jgi:phage terminase large subunit GpA-like protein
MQRRAAAGSAAARGCGRSPPPPSRARPTGFSGCRRPSKTPHPCPAGFIHLPRGVDAEWIKQLVGEQLVTVKTRRGFTRLEWQKLRERNEALDCRVYARAAAWIAGIDRWSERKWRELERQLGIETKLADSPSRMPRTPAENRANSRP